MQVELEVQSRLMCTQDNGIIHTMQWRAVLFKQLLVVGIPTKLNHAAMSLVLEEKQYYLVRKIKLNPQSQPCQPVTFSRHFFDRLSLIISPQLLCLPVTHAQQQQFNHFCTAGQQLPVESFQLSFMFRLYMIELLTCQSCRVAAETFFFLRKIRYRLSLIREEHNIYKVWHKDRPFCMAFTSQ